MPSSRRKLKPDTITQRWFKTLGWHVDQCHRKEGPNERDMFGVADQYAWGHGMHVWIQSTSHRGRSTGNMSERVKKIIASEDALDWKRDCAGNLIFVVGWKDDDGQVPPRVVEIRWDPVDAKLVAVTLVDPAATLDVRDPECLARAR